MADMRSPLHRAFIGIAGLIGVGKSTLARKLGEHLGLDVYCEPVDDNVYLEDFYADTLRHSFAMQVYLLNRRFQQHQEIIWRGRGAVQDRTIYEDSIFAKVLMDMGLMLPRDYETYVDLFRNLANFMCRPNVIVYLDASPETTLERIQSRGRGCEQGISLEYLQRLHHEYGAFVTEISRIIPVIRVGWERFGDIESIADAITREYIETNYLRDVRLP
ncbi:MAG: deoxynucleoside kinase [Candidatus Krumholzibacteriia bacterium]